MKKLALRVANDKLHQRCLWAGLILTLGICIPYEQVQGQPHFLWELWQALPSSAQFSAASVPLTGLLIVLLRWRRFRPSTRAFAALFLVVAPQTIRPTAQSASAWFAATPPFGPLAHDLSANLGLAAAATALALSGPLAARDRAQRRQALALAFVSLIASFIFVALGCGNSEFFRQLLRAIQGAQHPRRIFGIGVLLCLQCWPLLIATVASLRVLAGPWRHAPTLSLVATFSYPFWSFLLATMYGSLGATPLATVLQILSGLLLASELALMSAALHSLARLGLGTVDEASETTALRRRFTVGTGCGLSVLACLIAIQRIGDQEHQKGVRWPLGAITKEAEQLYTEALPRWNALTATWRPLDGATASARAFNRFGSVRHQAEKVDHALAERLEKMAKEALRVQASPRRFYGRVAAVNARARQLGLPFYLDPRLSFRRGRQGPMQKRQVAAFRLIEAPSFHVGDQRHTVLLVQRLSSVIGPHRSGLLGLSRDHQPFAVVLVDEVNARAEELRQEATRTEPRCGHSSNPRTQAAFALCGRHLRKVIMASDAQLGSDQLTLAIRHELQHQLDGPSLPMARLRLAEIGSSFIRQRARRYRRQLNREVSAFLAEAGDAQSNSRLALTTLLISALQESRAVHRTAAEAVFLELASAWPVANTSRVERLIEIYRALMEKSDDQLKTWIQKRWETLFGRRLPSMHALPDKQPAEAKPAANSPKP